MEKYTLLSMGSPGLVENTGLASTVGQEAVGVLLIVGIVGIGGNAEIISGVNSGMGIGVSLLDIAGFCRCFFWGNIFWGNFFCERF